MVLWQHPKMFVYDLSLFTLQTSVWAKHKLILYLHFPTQKLYLLSYLSRLLPVFYGVLSSAIIGLVESMDTWVQKKRQQKEEVIRKMPHYDVKILEKMAWHRLRKHLNCTPSLAARIFPVNPFLSISCQQIIRMFLRVTNAFLMVIYICSVKSTLGLFHDWYNIFQRINWNFSRSNYLCGRAIFRFIGGVSEAGLSLDSPPLLTITQIW